MPLAHQPFSDKPWLHCAKSEKGGPLRSALYTQRPLALWSCPPHSAMLAPTLWIEIVWYVGCRLRAVCTVLCCVQQVNVCVFVCLRDIVFKEVKASSALAVVVNAPRRGPVVTLPPAPAPPHGQDGVSVHSGSRERDRRCGDSGGGRRNLGRGRQPPLVLKPETTRSGLIYRERRGRREGGRREMGDKEDTGWAGMWGKLHDDKPHPWVQNNIMHL